MIAHDSTRPRSNHIGQGVQSVPREKSEDEKPKVPAVVKLSPDPVWQARPDIENQHLLSPDKKAWRFKAYETVTFDLSKEEDLREFNRLQTEKLSGFRNEEICNVEKKFHEATGKWLVIADKVTYEFRQLIDKEKPETINALIKETQRTPGRYEHDPKAGHH